MFRQHAAFSLPAAKRRDRHSQRRRRFTDADQPLHFEETDSGSGRFLSELF
jgi:hypothetical protein